MNYATIKYYDVANGPGVRTSLFVSGCTHRCEGCFNAIAWDFSYGKPFDRATEDMLLDSMRPEYVTGITLLGGEPMEPENQVALLPFLQRMRRDLPGKTIWCFSGYTWEQLTGAQPGRCRASVTDALLAQLDVMVDGPFLISQRDLMLRFRGSSNQRLLDVPASLAQGRPVWWHDQDVYASHGK